KKAYDIWTQSFDYSPNFRADNGFVAAAGVHGSDIEIGGHLYPTRGFALYIRPFVGGGREATWRGTYDGFYVEGKLGTNGWISFHPAEQDRVRGTFTRPYKYTEVHMKAT